MSSVTALPGTVISSDNTDVAGEDAVWGNPELAKAKNDEEILGGCASAGAYSQIVQDSEFLICTNFGLVIPGGNVVTGIVVTYRRKGEVEPTGVPSYETRVSLVGVSGSDNKANAAEAWEVNTFLTAVRGSDSALWGISAGDMLTALGTADFGVVFAIWNDGVTTMGVPWAGHVDWVEITAYYAPEAPDPPADCESWQPSPLGVIGRHSGPLGV